MRVCPSAVSSSSRSVTGTRRGPRDERGCVRQCVQRRAKVSHPAGARACLWVDHRRTIWRDTHVSWVVYTTVDKECPLVVLKRARARARTPVPNIMRASESPLEMQMFAASAIRVLGARRNCEEILDSVTSVYSLLKQKDYSRSRKYREYRNCENVPKIFPSLGKCFLSLIGIISK